MGKEDSFFNVEWRAFNVRTRLGLPCPTPTFSNLTGVPPPRYLRPPTDGIIEGPTANIFTFPFSVVS